jgi:uncharacterized protein (DUF1501 family)
MGLGAVFAADPLLHTVASTFAQSAGGTGNILVLCQLRGGLDALSLLSPFTNSVYAANRPTLAYRPEEVYALPDNPDYGITNLFSYLGELYGQGDLAVVQQVGYPNANGSHFESQEIYEFGVRDLSSSIGTSATWYERLRKAYFNEPFGVLDTDSIGDPSRFGYPDRTYRLAAQEAFARLARRKQATGRPVFDNLNDAYVNIDELGAEIRERTSEFESTGKARGQFYRAAQLASARLGTQIFKLNYGGFDTHGGQRDANESLFTRVDTEFRQFATDMQAMGLWERTVVCFYSEFGRRNTENGGPGTDHGQGGHMVLAGPHVNGGLHGQRVTTADLRERSLPHYVDFRGVFGQCIEQWLGFSAKPVFEIEGETYDTNVGSLLFT